MTSTAPAITVDRLTKAFWDERGDRAVLALDGVSFDVAAGEFVCLLGPSGCGKTTVLRILAGLDQPLDGRAATVDGSRPAMVFQETSIFPWMTVEDNVAYPLRLRGIGAAERRERVERLLTVTGLADFRRALPHQLSGGMKQRTAVGRALADDKDALLMDEPFGALDEQTRLTLQDELLRIWERTRKTVLFITHSVDEALTLADRILVMSPRPGRILAEIAVPFERPRRAVALKQDQRFWDLTARIWAVLRGSTS